MEKLTSIKITSLACLCLMLVACGSSDSSTDQVNRWDDGSGSSNTLIWNDGTNSNNMKWAD